MSPSVPGFIFRWRFWCPSIAWLCGGARLSENLAKYFRESLGAVRHRRLWLEPYAALEKQRVRPGRRDLRADPFRVRLSDSRRAWNAVGAASFAQRPSKRGGKGGVGA